MPTIEDIISPAFVQGYWDQFVKENPPFLFSGQLLPARTVNSKDIDYIVGQDIAPSLVGASALDSNTVFAQRSGFDTKHIETSYFKTGSQLDETTFDMLSEVMAHGSAAEVQVVQQRIFNDSQRHINNLMRTNEVLASQAVTTGKLDYQTKDSAIHITFDYGVPANHKLTSVTSWSDPAADIIQDIENVQDTMSDTGVVPAVAIINRKTFRYLTRNKDIIARYSVLANLTNINSLPSQAVIDYLQQETGIQFYVYDKTYPDVKDGTIKSFVPDDVCVFIPLDTIGYTNFSPTPDQQHSNPLVTGSSYNNLSIATFYKADPGVQMLRMGMRTVPTLEGSHAIAIMNIKH